MARSTAIKNTKMLLIRPFSLQEKLAVGRCMSKLARQNDHRERTDNTSVTSVAGKRRQSPENRQNCWMPHSRTGIYFPIGQERVMDDVPNGAASFDCTLWSRSIDGVDDDKPDTHNNSMHRNPN
ncbi:hypothetical protein OROHE_024479 [Orobanche hederae]